MKEKKSLVEKLGEKIFLTILYWNLRISQLYLIDNISSSIHMKVTVCTYVPFSCPNRWTNLPQILHTPTHQLIKGS